jgi:uncharacterized protein YqeY
MGLKDSISADMKTAMRERDTVRLDTVRLLRAAIQRREVDEQIELDDDNVLQVIQKMIKQCNDAADQFDQGRREDLSAKERASITVLEQYLPEQLSEDEIDKIVNQSIADASAASIRDMGKVMGLVKARVQGRADMGAVSARVKSLLT